MTESARNPTRDRHGPRKSIPTATAKPAPFVARLAGVPLELLLTSVRGHVRLEVEEPAGVQICAAQFRIDEGPWIDLTPAGRLWRTELGTGSLEAGLHRLEVRATRKDGIEQVRGGSFRVHNRPR